MVMAAPVMMALMIASTAVSAVAAISAGQAQSKAHKYNAAVAENNAIQARQAAAFEEGRQRDRSSRFLATQRAAVGASGITMEGSPLLVLADSAEQTELDALSIRYSGSVEEARQKSQAAAQRMQASAARTGGYFGAATSILRGATSMAGYKAPVDPSAWAAGGGSASP